MILPRTDVRRDQWVDWTGALLLVAGIASLMSGLTEMRLGWARPSVPLLIGAGLVLLAGFCRNEARHCNPILDLSLFRRAGFAGATVAAFASGAGVLALMTMVPTLLARAMHVDPLTAAIVLLAWSATSVATALAARRLPDGLPPRISLIGGLCGCALAKLTLLDPAPDDAFLRFLPGLFLAGAANGILNAALGRQAVATVPANRTAMGSGANNTARYLGSAIGITLAAVLIAHGAETGGMAGLIGGWNQAVFVTTGFSLIGATLVAIARD